MINMKYNSFQLATTSSKRREGGREGRVGSIIMLSKLYVHEICFHFTNNKILKRWRNWEEILETELDGRIRFDQEKMTQKVLYSWQRTWALWKKQGQGFGCTQQNQLPQVKSKRNLFKGFRAQNCWARVQDVGAKSPSRILILESLKMQLSFTWKDWMENEQSDWDVVLLMD